MSDNPVLLDPPGPRHLRRFQLLPGRLSAAGSTAGHDARCARPRFDCSAPLADTRIRSPSSPAAVWLERAIVKEEALLTRSPRAARERSILPQFSSLRPSSL